MAGKEGAGDLRVGVTGSSVTLSQPRRSGASFTLENRVGALPRYVLGPLGSSGQVPSEGSLTVSWAEAAPHSVTGLLVDRAQGAGGLSYYPPRPAAFFLLILLDFS